MKDSIPTVDWQFQTEPQASGDARRFHYARGKCLGGSSASHFMLYHRGNKGSYDIWADNVGDDSYRLNNFQKFFKRSATFTPPNTNKRRANATATTVFDLDDFAPAGQGGPLQVGYPNYVSSFATWAEQGLRAAGLKRQDGYSRKQVRGIHPSTRPP
ncbi:hypothetical protein HIM_11985 [Hirsutella minnesotensis 3608]|uniref:Glucose-methanol-choline oxidoreductase N-terminal domain-containing protein n=1 Tax=Hirsutella minnesotensis 3608 TaxID=1043627 RepID=A0A0F7ZF70_9HYPO|nr:hypothetical protein HIM_11985 [Hirsutella minnesotensis 3608]